MKKMVCVLLCAFMVFGLVACGGTDSIKGKWVFGANTYEFNDDGTFTSLFNGMSKNGTYEVEDGKITLSYTDLLGYSTTTEFTYTLDGDTLSLTGDVSLLGAMSMTVEFTKSK